MLIVQVIYALATLRDAVVTVATDRCAIPSAPVSDCPAWRVQKDMLEDHKRTGAYYQAVMQNRRQFEGKTVLDVGTGSGILAVFAAKAGARMVYAVEATAMARFAAQLVEHNQVSSGCTLDCAFQTLPPGPVVRVTAATAGSRCTLRLPQPANLSAPEHSGTNQHCVLSAFSDPGACHPTSSTCRLLASQGLSLWGAAGAPHKGDPGHDGDGGAAGAGGHHHLRVDGLLPAAREHAGQRAVRARQVPAPRRRNVPQPRAPVPCPHPHLLHPAAPQRLPGVRALCWP